MTSHDVTLDVNGMSCGHCSGMVQKTLEEIDGVSGVSVDLEAKKAFFKADAPGLVDVAIEKINNAGYKASNAG